MGLTALAMAGVAAASSLASSASAASAANKTAKAQSKAAIAFNQKVMAETARQVNQINLERAQLKQQLVNTRFGIGAEANQKTSAVNAQAGATDTIGASVQDAVKTVAATASMSTGTVDNQYMDAIEASNQKLYQVTTQGMYDLQGGTKSQGADIMKQGIWSAIGAGAGAALGATVGKPTAAPAAPKDVPSTDNSFWDRFGMGGTKTTGSALDK